MEGAPDIPQANNRTLNRMVATTVVILSVAMALTKIKDDNIVQAMQADKAAMVDSWSEYQAAKLKLHVQEVARTTYRLSKSEEAAGAIAEADKAIAKYDREAADLKAKALATEADYDKQGYRDDQFDLSDGFSSIALAVTAIAALIESYWLLGLGWGAAGFGLAFSIAGFAGLPLHPDALVAFLT
jgi:Domain of unknown function (DUF4337)